MKVAVIGSRDITQIDDFASFLPEDTDTIISGGARGVDTLAKTYAMLHAVPLIEILPDYKTYGKRAPLIRNQRIVALADFVLAFWDGRSGGTAYTIRRCRETGVPIRVFVRTERKDAVDTDQLSFFPNEDKEPSSHYVSLTD